MSQVLGPQKSDPHNLHQNDPNEVQILMLGTKEHWYQIWYSADTLSLSIKSQYQESKSQIGASLISSTSKLHQSFVSSFVIGMHSISFNKVLLIQCRLTEHACFYSNALLRDIMKISRSCH